MTGKQCHPERSDTPPGHARIPSVERRADGTHKDPGCRTAFCRNTPSYIRDSSASRPQNDSCAVILSVSDLPTRRDRRVALTGILPLSHASRRAAAGRYSLRLSMCARHYVPNAHASLREIPPCGAARRSSVPPPQSRSLPLPLAAVATLPPPGHARIPSVEQGARSGHTRTPCVGRMANGRDSSSFHSSE